MKDEKRRRWTGMSNQGCSYPDIVEGGLVGDVIEKEES